VIGLDLVPLTVIEGATWARQARRPARIAPLTRSPSVRMMDREPSLAGGVIPARPTAERRSNMHGVRKVALTGFFGRGNFGDDLMAVIFGRHLQSLGIPFRVHKFPVSDARRFGFETAESVDELLEDCQALVWGGGGLLVSRRSRLYHGHRRRFIAEQTGLVESAIRHGMRLAALSIGGDGVPELDLFPPYKARFLDAAETVSVRNEHEVLALHRLGIPSVFFPDIVWQARRCLPVTPTRPVSPRVGIDLYKSGLIGHGAFHVPPLLNLCVRIRRDLDFVFMDSTCVTHKPFRAVGIGWSGPNLRTYQFRDFEEDIRQLSSLDLLVSSRLHVPIVALQYGVPVISCFAEPKTSAFMASVGLADFIVRHSRLPALVKRLIDRNDFDGWLSTYPHPAIERLQAESLGHLTALSRFVGA
jgi:Polysaccharide pyruvyl transferase